MTPDFAQFVRSLPKAELHIHIEGSLEPELMFALAARNGIGLPYPDVASLRRAYAFSDLQSFLDIYYAGAAALRSEADFFDMAWAYLQRAHADGVVHAELFFDPQTHTARGVALVTVIDGLERACRKAEAELGLSSALILCFLRHLSEREAFETLEEARPHLGRFIGVGLDSSEVGHPPEKFERVFAEARRLGLRAVAHAGEEGPPEYIWSALDRLQVERIDHGVQAVQDPRLLRRLAEEQVALTVCPLSNVKLCVYAELGHHRLPELLDAGVAVTLNSDDPAYFGGYILDNYLQTAEALKLDAARLAHIADTSLRASFLDESRKARLRRELADYCEAAGLAL